MIKFSISALGMALFFTSSIASAQTPPEVLKAYKDYNTAMELGNYKLAIKHAKKAWTEAEKLLGENVVTGDLAYNYGYVEKNKGENKKSIEALVRSVDLAALKSEDGVLIQLEREVEVISSLEAEGQGHTAKKRVDAALNFAKSNGEADSIFAGELYLHDANACVRGLNSKIKNGKPQLGALVKTGGSKKSIREGQARCARIAQQALDVFAVQSSDARPTYVAAANNFVGYSLETQKNWFEAAMSYQNARQAVEAVYPRDHPMVAQSIGRWLNARNYLKRTDRLDYALSNGLCKCWPYVQETPKVEASKTVTPNFPAKAMNLTSGYAIVQYDVSDSGVTQNLRVLNSWPGSAYDKSSIAAIKKWEYPAKTDGEPKGFRKDLMAPLSYFLSEGLNPT